MLWRVFQFSLLLKSHWISSLTVLSIERVTCVSVFSSSKESLNPKLGALVSLFQALRSLLLQHPPDYRLLAECPIKIIDRNPRANKEPLPSAYIVSRANWGGGRSTDPLKHKLRSLASPPRICHGTCSPARFDPNLTTPMRFVITDSVILQSRQPKCQRFIFDTASELKYGAAREGRFDSTSFLCLQRPSTEGFRPDTLRL